MTTVARLVHVAVATSLPWRATRDRWAVLVAEVMLQQTQVARVEQMWDCSSQASIRKPVAARARARPSPCAGSASWIPARGRRLWESAGRPRSTAGPTTSPSCRASVATPRARSRPRPTTPTRSRSTRTSGVVERVAGRQARPARCRCRSPAARRRLSGRDRLLALMDLGALVCTNAPTACATCPLHDRAYRGPFAGERTRARHRSRDRSANAGPRLARTYARHRLGRPTRCRRARVTRRRRARRSAASAEPPPDRAEAAGSPILPARKLRSRSCPPVVRIDSGWNCTPSTGRSRWRSPITNPSSDSAVISSSGGHRLACDDERVVAGRGERVGQPGEHAGTGMTDLRRLAVHHPRRRTTSPP